MNKTQKTNLSSNDAVLQNLNEQQKQAVLHFEGPILIIAGAGSGKTKVLTHRVARLIEKGVAPQDILAVTFTNKAAGEMKERILKLLHSRSPLRNNSQPSTFHIPFISTFHSLGVSVLRESGKAVNVPKNFSILDEEDSLAVIKESIKELELDPKQFQPSRIKAVISHKKGEVSGPEVFNDDEAGFFGESLLNIWTLYDKKLEERKSLDFDDLIKKTAELLKNHSQVLAYYQDKWRFINIDEYQDTNYSQYVIVNLLAKKHKNICVVGDVDQSIYGWRGADFRNILNFERDYPEAKIITLEENYRSTRTILDAANAVISKNKLRRPKNLFTEKTGGEDIFVFESLSEKEEADFIAAEAETALKNGARPNSIAVLYRTNFQSRILEEEFLKRTIPYQVIGIKFYARKEIKDILAYLKLALNREDLTSLKRIINVPPRNIGKTLFLKYLTKKELNPKEKERTENFENIIEKTSEALRDLKASEAIKSLLKRSGYLEMLKDKTEEAESRLFNVKELVTIAAKFDKMPPPSGIESLLEEAALMSDQDTMKNNKEGVRLMTVHAAKGLEFDCVFVSGLEEGLFPHTTMAGGVEEKNREEEERRLFYVALTRAKEKLFLSYAATRTIFGSRQINLPSRFLSDIPEELLKTGEKTIEIQ